MPRITLAIKTPFGEIMVGGETPQEVLDALRGLDQAFVGEVNERISELLATQAKDDLKGIVEIGRDGPVIVTKERLSHYEAIGLILYSVKDHQASSREITGRLAASGKKVTVPARLHEMRRRGHIFKPVDRAPYYKLSTKGVKWIEEEVIPPLRKK
jgi:hypothetical protein